MKRSRNAVLLVLLACAGAALPAPPASALSLERVGTFDQPVYVTGPAGAGGRVFVVERRGVIRIVRRGRLQPRPFLDLKRQVLIRSRYETEDQRGMLSVAFAPDYAASGRFYVFFVDRRDRIRVDELRRSPGNPDRAVAQTRRTLLAIEGAGRVHHGGQLAFGPDGMLYASIGFGDREDTPQDPESLRGKILRLDPKRGGAPEVWASGMRNPYRFSFDRGRLIVADVGGTDFEEVSIVPSAGGNLGWPLREGDKRLQAGLLPAYVPPVLTHAHGSGRGWCSIVGGYVVRTGGPEPLRGDYVYGDVCSGRVYAANLAGRPVRKRRLPLRVPYLVSFGSDSAGRIYVVSFTGRVWRLRA